MDPFDNHTFQPNAVVRRADLALAMSRLLTRLSAQDPARARAWTAARVKFADLAATHLAYPAASMSVAAGVIPAAADNKFEPARVVTGAEAVGAVARIATLSGVPAPAGGPGRSGAR
jgi:hypothetical protein